MKYYKFKKFKNLTQTETEPRNRGFLRFNGLPVWKLVNGSV